MAQPAEERTRLSFDRAAAWSLLTEFTRSESLRRHARAVEAFARTVNRDDVHRGAAELDVDLEAHIAFVVGALTGVAPEIGLTRG